MSLPVTSRHLSNNQPLVCAVWDFIDLFDYLWSLVQLCEASKKSYTSVKVKIESNLMISNVTEHGIGTKEDSEVAWSLIQKVEIIFLLHILSDLLHFIAQMQFILKYFPLVSSCMKNLGIGRL